MDAQATKQVRSEADIKSIWPDAIKIRFCPKQEWVNGIGVKMTWPAQWRVTFASGKTIVADVCAPKPVDTAIIAEASRIADGFAGGAK